jgi:hypothetical protein
MYTRYFFILLNIFIFIYVGNCFCENLTYTNEDIAEIKLISMIGLIFDIIILSIIVIIGSYILFNYIIDNYCYEDYYKTNQVTIYKKNKHQITEQFESNEESFLISV